MPALTHPFLPLIAETLATTHATRIVCIGARLSTLPWPASAVAGEALSWQTALQSASQRQRAELAIAILENSDDAREARQLIAVMRDLLARQLLVFVPEKLLDGTTLIGLGLTRQAQYELAGESWQAWSFDIRTYKSVPDWLNPKFWANPENWNKYRW
ncbi:MAG: DUF6231 family protein [bacterium]|nr:DUF6231 family protein [bacterium]